MKHSTKHGTRSIYNVLENARNLLKSKNVDSPLLDAELLLAFILGDTREYLISHPERIVTHKQWLKFKNLVSRRAKREPLAYIIGEKEFYGLRFFVNHNTLIPRPATESLVEATLQEIEKTSYKKIVLIDVGTGSGCVAISIAKNFKNNNGKKIKLFASDASSSALGVAKKNAQFNNVIKKITFLHGNLFKPFLRCFNLPTNKLIVVANLPYLKTTMWKNLWPEIKKYEPKNAFVAGKNGLKYYEELLKQIYQAYKSDIAYRSYKTYQTNRTYWFNRPTTCLFEINPDQTKSLSKIILKYFPKARIKFTKDLAGATRVCKILI